MICNLTQIETNKTTFEKLIIKNIEFYWKGFIFIPGLKDGKESLEYFINNYPNYEENIDKLYGSYILIIKDSRLDQTISFSDNSGFMKVYYSKETASDSFLTLSKYINASLENLDIQGIAEFIRMGYCFDKTFVSGLSILNKRFYIKWINNSMSILTKKLSVISEKGTDFYSYFEKLSKTLEGKAVLCDLTGGTDSRMLVSLMEHFNLEYVVGLSGRKDFIDYIKCEEISDILKKKPITFEYHEKFETDMREKLFIDSDGQYPMLEIYRNYCYDKNLKNKEFDIRLTGGNGELFKSEAWPKPYWLFSKKMIRPLWGKNSKRFKVLSIGLTNVMQAEIEKVNEKIADIKLQLELNNATETLDNFLYEIVMFYKASNFNIIANNVGLKQYSPLLEYDIARVGFNLKRSRRTAVRFHKKIITETCPKIAKVKTAKNYSCYNNFFYILHDYLVDIKTFSKHIANRIFKSTQLLVTAGATGDKLYLSAKENCSEIETLLKKHNIIDNNFKLSDANNIMFDRLLTIGMFLKHTQ